MRLTSAVSFWRQIAASCGGLYALAAIAVALPSPAHAEPLVLSGSVGAASVLLTLDRQGDRLAGWYVYLRVGKQIRLEGRRQDNGAFAIDEFAPSGDRKTGRFTGTVAQGRWTGTWQRMDGGRGQPVALSEGGRSLADLTATLRCAASRNDREFGYRYRYALDLRVTKGKIGKLVLDQRATSKAGDDQGCGIDLDDLKQAAAGNDLLLRDSDGAGKHRCSVRLIGAGDYIYVRIGDTAEEGNDCRGSDAVAYCSPRSFWADMIVRRKTQHCQPVQ